MTPKLYISSNRETTTQQIEVDLESLNLKGDHPDVLWFGLEDKMGIGEARKIQQFLSLKPIMGESKAVVIEDGGNLTPEAQNALLKTLEELNQNHLILIGALSDETFLTTVLSRIQKIELNTKSEPDQRFFGDIEKLLQNSIEDRFLYIEKLEDKEGFLKSLQYFFHQKLKQNPELVTFTNLILEAQKWQRSRVNVRTILEYLMLELPGK